jgi:hypothetical protein
MTTADSVGLGHAPKIRCLAPNSRLCVLLMIGGSYHIRLGQHV